MKSAPAPLYGDAETYKNRGITAKPEEVCNEKR